MLYKKKHSTNYSSTKRNAKSRTTCMKDNPTTMNYNQKPSINRRCYCYAPVYGSNSEKLLQ